MSRKLGIWIFLAGLAVISFGYGYKFYQRGEGLFNPLGDAQILKDKPYEKYRFESLVERIDRPSKIEIGRELAGGEGYKSYVFYYQSEGRRISGQINYPELSTDSRKSPVVVMARGYVDKDIYETGIGTKNAAGVYARNGYITLAPDFSGYGESDKEDENGLGARMVKPVEILDLLASIPSVSQADLSRVYLWGHSNGGQIMLSVAEIIGKREPSRQGQSLTVRGMSLWAPVSKPFPYSILYYTDEASDSGKWLRKQVAKFEEDYDAFDYSIDRYLDWITVPILIHQGGLDDAVPKKWSDTLVESLKMKDKSVTYFVYPTADHNLRPNWDNVVIRDLEFFGSN